MASIRNKFAALALLAVGCGFSQNPADLARSAMAKQAAGDYAGAAVLYQELLRLDPNQVATHVNLGIVLVQLGRFDEAVRQYDDANRLLPGDPRIALNKALAYSKAGRIREAADQFAPLHTAAPENRQVTMLLADTQLQLGNNKAVTELLRPLATSGDNDLGLAYMLGLALLRTGETEEGGKQLDRILRNGDTAEAHFLLGTRMFEAGDYPASVRELAGAVKINARLPQLQSLYGRALLNTGDPQGAREAFEAELAARPGDYDANAGLGQILTAEHKFDAALPLLQRAMEIHPESFDVQHALAQSFAGLHHWKEALPHGQAAVSNNQKSSDAHQVLSEIQNGLGFKAEAQQEHSLALALRRESEPAPHAGDLAPDFALPATTQGNTVKLSGFRDRKPVVLVFGSYSCPNLRSAAVSLRHAYERYASQLAFVLVYIREAHTNSSWESTRNGRDGIRSVEAGNLQERESAASSCARKLHLPFLTLTDTMDGHAEQIFNGWPSRLFLLDKRGRITYSSRLTALDFSSQDFETALRALK